MLADVYWVFLLVLRSDACTQTCTKDGNLSLVVDVDIVLVSDL